jgi:hypothetical protein
MNKNSNVNDIILIDEEKFRFVCDEAYNKNNISNNFNFGSKIKKEVIMYLILIILKVNFMIMITI